MMEGGNNSMFNSSGLTSPYSNVCTFKDNFDEGLDIDTHTDDGFDDSHVGEMTEPRRSLPPAEFMRNMPQPWGTSADYPGRRVQQDDGFADSYTGKMTEFARSLRPTESMQPMFPTMGTSDEHPSSRVQQDKGFGDSFAGSMGTPARTPPQSTVMRTMQTMEPNWATSDEHPSSRVHQMDPSVGHYYAPGSSHPRSGSSVRNDWSSGEWDDTFTVNQKTYGKSGAMPVPYPPGDADTGACNRNIPGLQSDTGDTGATSYDSANFGSNSRQKNTAGNTRQRGSRVDPISWDEDVTTVMVRQIPRKYSQIFLVEEVERRGFAGLFDFIYLPFDFKKGANVGYGFLNFIDKKYARAFRDTFDGNYLEQDSGNKARPLHVHPASVQGYDANYQHFAQTKTGQKQDPQLSPLFFPHLSKKQETSGAENNAQVMQCPFTTPINQTDMAQLAPGQFIVHQGQMMAAVPGNMAVPVTIMQVPQMPIQDVIGTGAQAPPQPNGRFCPSCGGKHLAGHNFCSFCGFNLSSTQQSPQQR